MSRPRLIRNLLVAFCAMCIAVWVGSHFRQAYVRYLTADRDCVFRVVGGSLDVWSLAYPSLFWDGVWDFEYCPADLEYFESKYDTQDLRFGGFAFSRAPDGSYWEVIVPLWFPAVCAALPLWLIWRKERIAKASRGFPIEPTAKPK
jgi:hypothetical protein